MATAIVTGSGGLIGSESVQYFVEQGFDVVGLENDLRSQFFGAGRLYPPGQRAARRALPGRVPLDRARHPRRRRRRRRSSPSTLRTSSSSSTPPRSRRTTGRRATRRRTSASTRTGRSTCSRRRGSAQARRDVRLLLDEQGLRRPAELPAAPASWTRASSCPRITSTTTASRPRCRSTSRCTRSSASRRRRRT